MFKNLNLKIISVHRYRPDFRNNLTNVINQYSQGSYLIATNLFDFSIGTILGTCEPLLSVNVTKPQLFGYLS
jgi:hypothetical protein